jgi:myb proto-oncogene protein
LKYFHISFDNIFKFIIITTTMNKSYKKILTLSFGCFLSAIGYSVVPDSFHDRWQPTEDDQLRQLVTQHGAANWPLIASFVTGRTARQCRDRWNRYLNPILNRSPWTPEEDDLLSQERQRLGAKWTQIATFFLGRTDMQCKNRWHMLQSRDQRTRQTLAAQQQGSLPAQQPAAVLPAQSTQQSAPPPAAPQNNPKSYFDSNFTDPFDPSDPSNWWY